MPHIHNRPDGDKYVRVKWDNTQEGRMQHFQIDSNWPMRGLPFDYRSILHYSAEEHGKNGKITIVGLQAQLSSNTMLHA